MNAQFTSKFVLHQQKILTALDRAEIRALTRFGAFARRRMRSKLRRRKKSAKNGQAPSVHSKHKYATLKNIQFYVDAKKKTTIIGAVKLRSSKVKGTTPLPELLEFGKTGVVSQNGVDKSVDYRAFPFAGPTLDEELAQGTLHESLSEAILP
ncbi:hypothetical protein [Rhodopirellula halodulae]|uniref:hypothetical protein n=1 Tax=Rhodopirellula halodulae TaxID=2894198 RepID=UPI001E416D4F|nr:hypothetical protein [Rhodopirellula sp. JC737]MCC9655283.1 hypothetical protein [Rhodopirellula sp. JC737]